MCVEQHLYDYIYKVQLERLNNIFCFDCSNLIEDSKEIAVWHGFLVQVQEMDP